MRNVETIDLTEFKTVRKGKRLVAALGDYFLVFIFSFLLFTVCFPIVENLSYTKEIKSSYQLNQDKTVSILRETHLQSFDEKRVSFVPLEEDADSYVLSLIRTSFYHNGMRYYEKKDDLKEEIILQKKDTLSYQVDGVYLLDPISEYFLNFRNDNRSLYQDTGSEGYTRKTLNQELLKLDDVNSDLVPEGFDLSDSFYLSENNANLLSDYYLFQEDNGKTLYQRIVRLYESCIQKGIDEIESGYQPYLKALNGFQKDLYRYSSLIDWSMILCYIFGFIISYVIFPSCYKRGRTISYRFLSLFPLRNDGLDLGWNNYLLKYLLLFIEQFSSVFFLPLLLAKLNVLSMPFLGPISLFQIILFSFLLSLLSIVFLLISKDNQTLSEFASSTYTVDTKRALEVKKVIKGTNSL